MTFRFFSKHFPGFHDLYRSGVPAEAVLDSGGDFVDQTWDVVGEGAVDDDDVRVEGVENRVQADSDVVGEILHYFAGVGVAFLVILDEAFDGDVF